MNTYVMPMFDLGSLIQNLVTKAKNYSSGFIIFLGIIMIAVAAFKIGKGLMTQGKPNAQPINWFLCGGLILIGGTMAFGGFTALSGISKSVGNTVDDLAGGNDFTREGNSKVGEGNDGSWEDLTNKVPKATGT